MGNSRMSGPTWDALVPQMKSAVLAILARAKAEGLAIMFFQGWRSAASEEANMQKGTSWVGTPYDSMHVWGAAADFAFIDAHGQPYWPPADSPLWQQFGQIAHALGLVWGGDWTERDMDHVQLANVNAAALHQQYGDNVQAWIVGQGATLA